jgi:hypothetical protein
VLREPDLERRDAALLALADLAFDVPAGTTLRFDSLRLSVRPEDTNAPPLERRVLCTIVTGGAEDADPAE